MSESQSVPDLLLKWGLSDKIIQNFIDNDISLKSLGKLKQGTIHELIPQAGPRTIFEDCLSQWKESQVSVEITVTTPPATNGEEPQTSTSTNKRKSVDLSESPKPIKTAKTTSNSPKSPEIETPPKKIIRSVKKEEPSINGLHATLKGTTEGIIVISFFNNFQYLDSRQRDELASRAIYGELADNYQLRIPVSRYLEIADEIVELFPTEIAGAYCLVSTRNKKSIVTGKLRHHFYNIRRKFIQVGLILKSKVSEELLSDEGIDLEDDEDDENILWLKAHDRPWKSVLEKWEVTLVLRSRFLKKCKDLSEYIKTFPGLHRTEGYELLVNDFESEMPSLKDRIATHWPQCLAFLKVQLLKKLPNLFDAPEEQHTSLILMNFAQLFKVRNLPKQSKTKEVWRPARAEVQQAFLLQIKEISELDKLIAERQAVLVKFGFTFQPFPVIVGPLDNIRQCLVIFEKRQWIVPSPLQAIDICFKVHGALNSLYPPEARHMWLFIQRIVYEQETRFDFEKDPALKSFLLSHLKDFSLFVKSSSS